MNQFETNSKIEEVIEEQGFFMCSTVGVSMYPMLRNRRDVVVIVPVTDRLKKKDVALYKRNDGYVFHRVIKVMPDHYIIRGDNCYYKEVVTDDMVIGVLKEFYRGKTKSQITPNGNADSPKIELNSFKYQVYIKFWPCTYPIRWAYHKAKDIARRFVKKCIKNKHI